MSNPTRPSRARVTLFGETNAGKSALFNAILGEGQAIVSDKPGTTTDPVSRAMELLPFGPIALTDTAGLGDDSELGPERERKTRQLMRRSDLALYLLDASAPELGAYQEAKAQFEAHALPHLLVISKADLGACAPLLRAHPEAIAVCAGDADSVAALRAAMARRLLEISREEPPLAADLVPRGGVVVLVAPADSEAPKGRMILPQVQLIRECLDSGVRCHVTGVAGLSRALAELASVDLVVTDSQVFSEVAKLVPKHIPLTSFSILLTRQKGALKQMLDAIRSVASLRDGDRVLIAEACAHTRSHEDIGSVKIPALLARLTGKTLDIEFARGREFPEDLSGYALVVHCGGCMISGREFSQRVRAAQSVCVPITNYGVLLAHGAGVLELCAGWVDAHAL